MSSIMRRVLTLIESPRKRILDIGAAQGRNVVALEELGYEAYGVEPWADARDAARELGARVGVEVRIEDGVAESLPFSDGMFDVVIANSVLEHVDSVERSLAEVWRVLRPGGVFWFATASSLCPRQAEIGRFPLFGWYPDPLKTKIMLWARDNRPELIGHTSAPALHWFTPRKTRRLLADAGFTLVRDRWELSNETGERPGLSGIFVSAACRWSGLRLVGDVCVQTCSYAAMK